MVRVLCLLVAVLTSATLSSCGSEQPMEYTEEGEEGDEPAAPQLKRRTFSHAIAVAGGGPPGSLALANATAFRLHLTGCKSTYDTIVDETKAYLEVYEFDRNCDARLLEFTLNGKVYVPSVDQPFRSWSPGQTAVFQHNGGGGSDRLDVEILSTIASPVVAQGTIHYQFSEITQGATEELAEAVVRESAELRVDGQASPQFRIRQVQLVDITDSGNGEFRFHLECDGQPLSGSGVNLACYDVLLSSIRMALVEDTYPSATLTQSDLQSIFQAANGGIAIDLTTEALAPGQGNPPLASGGFMTAGSDDPDVLVLPGARPMIQHPHMILALKAGPSYTYFHIVVKTISQNNGQE